MCSVPEEGGLWAAGPAGFYPDPQHGAPGAGEVPKQPAGRKRPAASPMFTPRLFWERSSIPFADTRIKEPFSLEEGVGLPCTSGWTCRARPCTRCQGRSWARPGWRALSLGLSPAGCTGGGGVVFAFSWSLICPFTPVLSPRSLLGTRGSLSPVRGASNKATEGARAHRSFDTED